MVNIDITSVNNKAVKRLVRLRDDARARRVEQRFIIEGIRMVADADPTLLEEIYMTEDLYEEMMSDHKQDTQRWRDLQEICVRTLLSGITLVSSEVYRKISDTQSPQGVLGVARMPENTMVDMLYGRPLILMCEDIRDPGNLGTMIRTAEAAGAHGIILSKGCVDPYNPKVVRATMTAIFRVSIVIVEDLVATMADLQRRGIHTYAAYLDPEQTTDYDAPDYTAGTAFLIGNEGSGLRKETAEAADQRIRIPMAGGIESLNAAMSAGILMYEAARQRRNAKNS